MVAATEVGPVLRNGIAGRPCGCRPLPDSTGCASGKVGLPIHAATGDGLEQTAVAKEKMSKAHKKKVIVQTA